VPCTVYEASGRIGGACTPTTPLGDGQTSECVVNSRLVDVTMRSLAARFGLTLADVNAAQPNASQDTNYFLGGYYTEPELAHDARHITPILAAQNKAIGTLATYNTIRRPDTSSTISAPTIGSKIRSGRARFAVGRIPRCRDRD